MNGRPVVLAVTLSTSLLAGCPIPQTVPEYPKGTSVTPPRIVADTAVPGADAAVIRVAAGCGLRPTFDLTAMLVDDNTVETVEARWFVDYEKTSTARNVPMQIEKLLPPPQPDPNAPVTTRAIRTYTFIPDDFGPAVGTVHVVELVVSNGLPSMPTTDALPNRTPLPGFETQVYRWVFQLVDPSADVPCPTPP